MKIKEYLLVKKQLVEDVLHRVMFESDGTFDDHIEAMRYSLFAGGKRVRPILCLAAAEAITDNPRLLNDLILVSCAIECIHTYSLIHDDLPAMDNDELRRGRPTNHIVHGEAEAILAGDGLLTFAFELLSSPKSDLPQMNRLQIINLIAQAAGPKGMVGGQSLDIAGENNDISFEQLQRIHKSKTGALIRCSVQAGAIGAGATDEEFTCLSEYGTSIGLAFQIVDDLLDATSTTELLGKTAGVDQQLGKATYPSFFGVEKTRDLALNAIDNAKQALIPLGNKAKQLTDLADYIYLRTC